MKEYDDDYLLNEDDNYDEDLEKYWEELELEIDKAEIKRKKAMKSHSYDNADDIY